MLEDHDVPRARRFRLRQLRAQPTLLFGQLDRRLLRRVDHTRVEHDAGDAPVAERVAVGAEDFHVGRDALGRGDVLHIVVARDVVDGNRGVDLAGDAAVFGNLRGVAGLVHEIARDDDKRGAQAVDGRDGEREVRGVLGEILVLGEHPELRIAQLDEEKRFVRGGAAGDEGEQQGEGESRQCFHGKRGNQGVTNVSSTSSGRWSDATASGSTVEEVTRHTPAGRSRT